MEHEPSPAVSEMQEQRERLAISTLQKGLFVSGEALMKLRVTEQKQSPSVAIQRNAARARDLIHSICPYAECDEHVYPNRGRKTGTQWYLRAVISPDRMLQPSVFMTLLRDYYHWWLKQPKGFEELLVMQDWKEREEDVRGVLRRTAKILDWHNQRVEAESVIQDFHGALIGYCGEFLCRALIEQMLQQLRVPADMIRLLHKNDVLLGQRSIPLNEECRIMAGNSYDLYVHKKNGRKSSKAEWDFGVTLGLEKVLLLDTTTSWGAAKEKFDRLYDVVRMRCKALLEKAHGKDVRLPVGLVIHLCDLAQPSSRWRLQSSSGPLEEHILQVPLRSHALQLNGVLLQKFPFLRTEDADIIKKLASKMSLETIFPEVKDPSQEPPPSSLPA